MCIFCCLYILNHPLVILQDSHFSDFVDKQTKYATKCMLTAPIMNGKDPIGVVMALNKQGAGEFSKGDQEVSERAHF